MLVSTLMHKEWYAWIGKRVCVSTGVGTLKFFGEIKSKSGFWCGIEFEEPIGDTDGTISGIQYFKCKANFGIFVPMHVVNRSRSTELTRGLDTKKLKVNVLRDVDSEKTRSKKSLGSLNQTFNKNKNKPPISHDTITKVENLKTDPVADVKNVNVRKRSKNSSHRVGTEESLGILSNLLEDEGSWDELGNKEKEDDSVFSPPIKTVLPSLKPQMYQTQFDKHAPFLKRTSTPKPNFKNIINMGATLNLDNLQFDASFHDEMEPIIAGSNATKSMDFDLNNFKQNEILCSTSKLTIPILPNESPLLSETPSMENEKLNANESITDKGDVENKVLMDVFVIAEERPKSTNVLNATYELISEQVENCTTHTEQEANNKNLVLEPTAINSSKMSNGMVNLNATFVLCADSPSPAKEADKTFVLDRSSVKPLERSSSVESEINFEKKSLSVIFENTMNGNLSVNSAVEHIDNVQATSSSAQILDSDKKSSNLMLGSENINEFDKVSNLSAKVADKEEIVSDLNSTFCIPIENVKGKTNNPVTKNSNARYSLSSISAKNNIPIQQRKSDIVDKKFIKQPQSLNNQKTTFKVPALYGATMKTKVIKNSAITIANKKVEVKDKLGSGDTSKSSSKDNMKADCAASTATMPEPSKRNVNSYKSVGRQNQQKENEVHVTLKITDKNTQIVARRKSVGGMVTKVTSKISYGSNMKSISENSNINLKVNNKTKFLNGFNSNLTNAKHEIVNRRHTMVPNMASGGMAAKTGVAKSKSDITNYTRTVGKPTATLRDSKCLQSPTTQIGLGNKKENRRDNVIKKPAQVERHKEGSPKDSNNQNLKPTVPRRELLKPGMLSRLPIAAKSIKKPGFLATTTKPIKT